MTQSNPAIAALDSQAPGLLSRTMSLFGRRRPHSDQIVALDVGTSKIVAVVATQMEEGGVQVEGFGSAPSRGLKAGAVVNIEETVDSIRNAVDEAEAMSECVIRNVNVGIAGSHIGSTNVDGAIPVRENEITPAVVERVLETASTVKIPDDKRILHVLPQEYTIDDQFGIRTPLGMSGVRLDAKVHLVTAGAGPLQNLLKCVRRCGLEVDHVVLEQLASAQAVLSPDERELGVCLVDIGGGTSDVAVYYADAIQHTATIPIAGDHVNRDIAIVLSTRVADAEQLKIQHGDAIHDPELEDGMLEVSGLGDRPTTQLRRSVLVDIIRSRYRELFELINDNLRRSGYYDRIQGAGVVLTGGGSMVRNLPLLAEEIFNRPVRIGSPHAARFRDERFKQPLYATSIGLLTHQEPTRQAHRQAEAAKSSWRQRLYEWV